MKIIQILEPNDSESLVGLGDDGTVYNLVCDEKEIQVYRGSIPHTEKRYLNHRWRKLLSSDQVEQ